MAKLTVDLGERSYEIIIAADLLGKAGELIASRTGINKVLLVSNPLVFSLYGEKVAGSLRGNGFEVATALMPDGESYKNIKEAMKIIDRAVSCGIERSSLIVALGGGVVGDLAGLVAAIYQRGVRFVQIPTTLLAQVDSSVGGKVAVNHRRGKNLIGAFHQPALVVADTSTLTTLSPRDYLSGLGEVIKYGVAFDADLFSYLEKHHQQILKREETVLEHVILRCCGLKSMVVAKDEREDNVRISLNLGHTFGHALEKMGNYREYCHGEAVAMGTVAASLLSNHLGMLSDDELERILRLFDHLGLPTAFPENPAAIYRYMLHDKKIQAGKLRLVLPAAIGSYAIRDDVSRAMIIRAMETARHMRF